MRSRQREDSAAPCAAYRAVRRSAACRLLSGTLLLLLGIAGSPPADTGAAQEPAHQCRFWGLIGTDYPDTLIADQLQTGRLASLRGLAATNSDGWGLGYYPAPSISLTALRPILHRGGPAANDPFEPDFDLAVAEIAVQRPRAVLAHVRRGTSGHLGIPDPHPLLMRFVGRDILFAHNGGLSADALAARLATYIEAHPLDYFAGSGETGPIDSELYGLYLQRYVEEHPELAFADALVAAVGELAADESVVGAAPRLNFLLTDGDTLYALHYYEGTSNPVRYAPESAGASPHWAVASEPLGSGADWGTVPPHHLAIFVPQQAPTFRAVGQARVFSSYAAGNKGRDRSVAARGARVRAAADEGASDGAVPGAGAMAGATPADPGHNCRFWSLVGSGYPFGLIEDHLQRGSLQNLRALGDYNPDGWALGYSMPEITGLSLSLPVIRRGGPPAPLDEDFTLAVAELREIAPPAAVGHVRVGTSGHWGIPDPHPFRHRGLLFAHNGSLVTSGLADRLGEELDRNPPDYTPGLPTSGYVDSELYFLYLLELAEAALADPGDSARTFLDALQTALQIISRDPEVYGSHPRLNFVMTRGDTLYALHYYGSGSENPVCYYPASDGGGAASSPFWIVASEPLGSSSQGWAEIPPQTLAMFVPGARPRFVPLSGPGLYFSWLDVSGTTDGDEDGWFAEFVVRCDPDVAADSAFVSAEVWGRSAPGEWFFVAQAPARWIRAFTTDTLRIPCVVDSVDSSLAPTSWDLKVTLRAAGSDSTSATPESHPDAGLVGFPVESAVRDETSDLPRELTFTSIARQAEVDDDQDGFLASFVLRVAIESSIPQDSVWIDLRAIAAHGITFFEIARSGETWVCGCRPNELRLPIVITPDDQSADTWHFALELYDLESQTLAARAWWYDHPAMYNVSIEGRLLDTAGWAGAVRPNPGAASAGLPFTIPILVPAGGATVACEIYDLSGRLVWRERPTIWEPGEQTIVWEGRDQSARRLASGVFFARVRVAARDWTRRFLLVR